MPAGTSGAIAMTAGTLTVRNSSIAGNGSTSGSNPSMTDIQKESVTVYNGGYNLIGNNTSVEAEFPAGLPNGTNWVGTASRPLDPRLGPLVFNGGALIHGLLVGSVAIDTGDTALAYDQRGYLRPKDGNGDGIARDDIGAFELEYVYAISGYVRTPNGEPIAGATVQLSTIDGTRQSSVTTDYSGFYSFSRVEAGDYFITPVKSGYTFNPTRRTVTGYGTDYTQQNFTGYNTTLGGRVAYSNGIGIAGVTIRLSTGRTVQTNSAGYYLFAGVIPGTYTVTPMLAGLSFDPAYRSVTINNENVGNVNFMGGYTISGRITDRSGKGLPNMNVYRTGYGPSSANSLTYTNSAGYYTFSGVANGTHTVLPDLAPERGYTFTPESRSVTINGASVGGQNFILIPLHTLSGRLQTSTGQAIAGASVRLQTGRLVTSNSAGYYTIPNLADGQYTITPTKSGVTFTPASRTVTINNADVSGQNFIGTPPIAPFVGTYLGNFRTAPGGQDLMLTVRQDGTVLFQDNNEGQFSDRFSIEGTFNVNTGEVKAEGIVWYGGDYGLTTNFTGTLQNNNGAVTGSGTWASQGGGYSGNWSVQKTG
jgi:hypothetical protein